MVVIPWTTLISNYRHTDRPLGIPSTLNKRSRVVKGNTKWHSNELFRIGFVFLKIVIFHAMSIGIKDFLEFLT